MAAKSSVDRPRIVEKIAAAKLPLANAVSGQFYLDHPDWLARYGERGRQFCAQDTCLHLDFLCGAIEAGVPESFADYALWTARMLAARGMANDSLKENFEIVGRQLSMVLSDDEYLEVARFLASGAEGCSGSEKGELIGEPEGPLRLTKDVFLAAILSAQRQAALNIVEEALKNGTSAVDIYVDVFAAAMHEVGKLWEANKITVAQEHMATAITQYAIASVYPKIVSSEPRRGQMIVTGVCGELHQIGANLVADAMESRGWSVRFLGSNIPHHSIVQAVEESSADVLCISTTIVANLPSASNLIRSVRARLGERAPRIILGGAAYRIAPDFAEDVGSLNFPADLRTAVASLCS